MGVPRNGEVSIRPLLEALSPTNAMLVLLAVLLERRVALVSSQLRLTTLVAEGVMQLLWPFRYQHVYVPLVPVSLLDLLEAPTPFLMGVGGHSGASLGAELAGESGGAGAGAGLAARVHEGLVVVDLDRNRVYNSADLRPSLDHPAAAQLLACLSHLVQPVSHDGGSLAEEEPVVAGATGVSPGQPAASPDLAASAAGAARTTGTVKTHAAHAWPDPWLHVVRTAASSGWGPGHDALVRRLFLRFFSILLRGYHQHLPASAHASRANTTGHGGTPPQRVSRQSPSGPAFRSADFLDCHVESHGPKSRPLLSQLLGTQGWYVMLDEWCGRAANPYGWYRDACDSCRVELLPDLALPDGAAGRGGEGAAGARAGDSDGAAAAAEREAEDAPALAHAGFGVEAGGAAAVEGRREVVVIGLPNRLEAGTPCEEVGLQQHATPADAQASLSPGRRVFYCRLCPLLQRRRAPVYRTFPALHVSDEPYAAAAAAAAASLRSSLAAPSGAALGPSPASAAMWQAWQAHVIAPAGGRAAREGSSGGAGAGGGAADAAMRSSAGGGVEADGAGGGGDAGGSRSLMRLWPSGPRLTRSLSSDNLSGELKLSQANAGGSVGGDTGKPPQRQRSSTDGTGNAASSYAHSKPPTLSAAATAPVQQQLGAGTSGGGPGLPRPSAQRALHAGAAGDAASVSTSGVAPTSAAAASPFATALGASLSLRNVLRGASVAGPMASGPAAGGGGGSSAAAAAAASAASSIGSVLPLPAAPASSRSLASYKAEQELVRQQLAALSQVLAWGAGQGGAAPAPGGAALPSRSEMDRLRQLLCVQTAGSGAFLVGRLRDEVFGGACGAAASPGGVAGAAGSPQAGVRTPVDGAGVGATAATAEAAAAAGGGAGGRCVHWAAFELLSEALDAVVSAAVAAGEFGVLGAALEVAMATFTYTGKGKVLLLHRLTTNPYLYTRAAWSGIFCHTLLAAAMAAATCGRRGGGDAEPVPVKNPAAAAAPVVAAADASAAGGHAALPLPQCEYLRRQRVLLQALQRSLSAQACWMMHLGVCEEPAWELVTGLVAAARVADLPLEGGQLQRLLLNVRAAMRAARSAASHQHRRRMPDPACGSLTNLTPATAALGLSALSRAGCGGTSAAAAAPAAADSRMATSSSPRWPPARGGGGQGPAALPAPVTPHLSFKDSGQSSGSQDDAAAAAAVAAVAAAGGRGNTAPGPDSTGASPRTPPRTALAAASGQGAGNSPRSALLKAAPPAVAAVGAVGEGAGKALAARALAAAAAASGAGYSPRSTAGSVRSLAAGGGPSRERPYRVQYERLLAIASSGGRLATVSGEKSPGGAADAQPPSPERRLGRSSASVKGGKPGKEPVQSAALSLGGRGRAPIMCLAAAAGVVLAAPRLPHYHLLALQPEGALRATARLPLAHMDGAYVDAAVLSADGATAAISVAPLPPPRHRPSPLPGAAAPTTPQPQRFPRVIALVDVAAERTVRKLCPAAAGRTTAMQMSPTANLLATGCAASWARLWDIRASAGAGGNVPRGGGAGATAAAAHPRVSSSAAVSLATGQGGVCALLADSGRLRLYTGGRDGSTLEWDLRKPNAPLVAYRGHSGWVTSLALLPAWALAPTATAAPAGEGLLLVTAGTDWTVRVWNPRDAAPVAVAAAAPAAGAPASAAPRGQDVSGGGSAGGARGTGRPSSGGSGRPSSQGGGGGGSGGGGSGRSRSSIAGARAAGVAAGPHAGLPPAAASNGAGPDGAVAVCRAAAVLVGHGAPVSALHVDQAAGLIYSGSRDGMLAAWTPDGSCAGVRRHHGGAVRVIAPYASAAVPAPTSSGNSSNSRQACPLVTCGSDGSVALWGGASTDGPLDAAGAAHMPDALRCGRKGSGGGAAEDGVAAGWIGIGAIASGGSGGGVWCGEEADPLAAFHAASLTRAAAWDAARGVMVVGDDRGVVRAWAPPLP
ncbi:hypothetical protein HXX76_010581 [Chlamydomonas incerta]|uniref:UDENN domain-containing protein n=1 Tax=Chlamydomonas incerta TaxID=51695 RepID=A0A835SR31_CHLIN|nr:hypothetical protein HXX76_010581 [Chlamydomonas incerta]|eukprot:KAG2429797.1 hypothetical protein HXX76_010581 [Chlamydomonas incerta]